MKPCSLLSRRRTGARVETGVPKDLLSGIRYSGEGRNGERPGVIFEPSQHERELSISALKAPHFY